MGTTMSNRNTNESSDGPFPWNRVWPGSDHNSAEDCYHYIKEIGSIVREDRYASHSSTNLSMLFMLTSASDVAIAFHVTELLGVDSMINYIAIHMYEQYICNRFACHLQEQLGDDWRDPIDKRKLDLVLCFKLAKTLHSPEKKLGIPEIESVLDKIGTSTVYERDTIIATEMEIAGMINVYQLNFTPFQCILILMAATGLTEIYLNPKDAWLPLLKTAYLKNYTLYTEFYVYYANKTHLPEAIFAKRWLSLKSNVLFLSAAIVFCTTNNLKLTESQQTSILDKLSNLSRTMQADISTMGQILLRLTNEI